MLGEIIILLSYTTIALIVYMLYKSCTVEIQHKKVKFMFYDIKNFLPLVNGLYKKGYVCLNYTDKTFFSRTEILAVEPLKATEATTLEFSKRQLEDYIIKNLITNDDIEEYRAEVISEQFRDDKISEFWWISDIEDFKRVVAIQTEFKKLLTSNAISKEIISEENISYIEDWFDECKTTDNISCDLTKIFNLEDVVYVKMLQIYNSITSFAYNTKFEKTNCAKVNLPYFSNRNSGYYLIEEDKYEVVESNDSNQTLTPTSRELTVNEEIDSNYVIHNTNELDNAWAEQCEKTETVLLHDSVDDEKPHHED